MKYSVSKEVFELKPELVFGVIIGRGITNGPASDEDISYLRSAEDQVRQMISQEKLKQWPTISSYREVMRKAGINPNKFPLSVEAMIKRVLKGHALPSINALVDRCNAVSLSHVVSLGAHDLQDIHEDLEVRFTTGSERFLPLGEEEEEPVEAGELVFTSGSRVQTRKWIWRQSELGKTTHESSSLIFQLAGFRQTGENPLDQAMEELKELIKNRFGGTAEAFQVTPEQPSAEFSR